ncbi:cache domain-containing sensor histidine kinase [Cohnella cellulosilytica]|uniref:Sensor histidine kinase n=1 Tax=Cohnella cellulosilytica TaxID=986710 RepID=A0ABW2F6N5_9BACL
MRNISFHHRTFLRYAFLIFILLAVIVTIFIAYIRSLLLERAEEGVVQSLHNVSSQLDAMIREMNILSSQVATSRELHQYLTNAVQFDPGRGNYFDEYKEEADYVRKILLAANTPKLLARRIMVFTANQSYISSGYVGEEARAVKAAYAEQPWIGDVLQLPSRNFMLPTRLDPWLSDEATVPVVSFVRPILATYTSNELLGAVEVQQPYSMLETIVQPVADARISASIYDADGNLVYPYGEQKHSTTGEKEVVFSLRSDFSGWTVVLAQPAAQYKSLLHEIQRFIYAAVLFFFAVSLAAIYGLSYNLNAPIRNLRSYIKRISIDNLSLQLNTKSNNDEIVLLHEAFGQMLDRLDQSINEAMLAKNSEMQANVMALQAQMNPHFLYNTLMAISAAGQELNSSKIVSMCSELSAMLRYAANYQNTNVRLKEELAFAENYLKLVKWRYEERFTYEISIDPDMREALVPKLILQPLLENCFAHGFRSVRPPWCIRLTGVQKDQRWEIKIRDNGMGFSEEAIGKLERMSEQLEVSLKSGGPYPLPQGIGALSLHNIWIRLKLLYGEEGFLRAENTSKDGTVVTIGGKSVSSEEGGGTA